MKRSFSTTLAIVGSALLGLGLSQAAQAATPWQGSWNYSNCSGSVSWGNSYNCTDGIAPSNASMNISAWSSDLDPNRQFVAAAVRPWGSDSGFGIVNRDECTPGSTTVCDPGTGPHAADNQGNLEGFLLKFSANPNEIVSVALNSIKLGWNGSDDTSSPLRDSDLSVYYYAGTPSTNTLESTTAAGLALATSTNAVNGWKLLSHINNVGTLTGNTATFNAGGISSSWWFVTANNSSLTGTNGNDAFKLLTVAGNGTTTTNKTPEPGSLALAAMALFGVAAVRRRAKKLGK